MLSVSLHASSNRRSGRPSSRSSRRASRAPRLVLAAALPARAQTPPPRFVDEQIFSGLTQPTAVRFFSDGRVLVAEKRGTIRLYASLTDTAPTTILDIQDQVHDYWDRGLLGLAIDPSFATSPYIYVLYALDARPGESPPSWGDTCPDPPGATVNGCTVQGRLSRFQLTGTTTGPEQVLVQNWCQQFPSHSVGSLQFGADGALYVSGGEGASFNTVDYGQFGTPTNPCGDPPVAVGGTQTPPSAEGGALRSQDIRTSGDPVALNGTILRVDPATGLGLPTNPLYGGAVSGDDGIIAYGLRNPYRFTIRPGTGEVWIGDVGWSTWEEIDVIASPTDSVVENFGWPCYEGIGRQGGYDAADLTLCESLYADPTAHTQPFYTYNHSDTIATGDGCPTGSSSISGLAFYSGTSYPPQYRGALFFADYSRNCIWAMLPDASGNPDPANRAGFVTNASGPVDLVAGPGGDLFYSDIRTGRIRRIRYVNDAPTAHIVASATSGAAPLTVTFDASTSTDPNGDTLGYAWDLDGDGLFDDSTAVAPSFTYPSGGAYVVRVRATDPSGLFDDEMVTINVDDTPPVAVIDAPGASLTWRVGDVISFSGHATDLEEGTLPASRLTWQIVLQHCSAPGVCHEHVILGISGAASGMFTAPDHEYPSYLEIRLTATDAQGLTDTTSVAIMPETTTIALATSPSGLVVALDGDAAAAPFTTTVLVGSVHTVSASSPQTLGGVRYELVGWSDSGAATHGVTATPAAISLTATFRPTCGNGVLQTGEDCDDGNVLAGDCCSPTCTFDAAGVTCAEDGDRCTIDACDGAGACTHPPSGACAELGAPCAADLDCESNHCVDGVCCDSPCGGGAGDDCAACSVAAGAPADGVCAAVAAGTECRAATGECDLAETCDGARLVCPPDARATAGTTCRDAMGDCDLAEACDGASGECPPDGARIAAGTECRAASGPCDLAEACDGASVACPDDVVASDGTDCDDGLACDGSEACEAGACASSIDPGCDDGDPCTEDSCMDPSGCMHRAIASCCREDGGCADAGGMPRDASTLDAARDASASPPTDAGGCGCVVAGGTRGGAGGEQGEGSEGERGLGLAALGLGLGVSLARGRRRRRAGAPDADG